MAIPATDSTFDVAQWFVERARFENGYLQAQKLQRMLWLAQGHYAATYHGRKLMPATFVAMVLGPQEPNIYRAYELGRPELADVEPAPEIVGFLDRLWGRFGHHSTDHLNRMVRGHQVYTDVLEKGEGGEISFRSIARYFTAQRDAKPEPVVRGPDGREWKKWSPRVVK